MLDLMSGLAALGGMAIVILLVALIIVAVFLYLGAKFAGIENATLGKAIVAVLGGGILEFIIAAVFSIVPIIGTLIGVIVGIIAYIWVIKAVFNTSWGKAAIAWLMTIVVEIIVVIILGVLLGVSILAAFM